VAGDRFTVCAATVGILAAAAESSPLLIVVDDLQWLDASSREVFRDAVGADEATWLRGRAWALSLAVMTFPYYWQTMPERCASRLAVARNVLADACARG